MVSTRVPIRGYAMIKIISGNRVLVSHLILLIDQDQDSRSPVAQLIRAAPGAQNLPESCDSAVGSWAPVPNSPRAVPQVC
jgi:hypothetical protein